MDNIKVLRKILDKFFKNNMSSLEVKIREQFINYIGESAEYVTDVLVKSLQSEINKDTLWRLFGDVIYYNIKRNLEGTKICVNCKERFKITNTKDTSSKYCENCKVIKNKEKKKKWKNKNKNSARSTDD